MRKMFLLTAAVLMLAGTAGARAADLLKSTQQVLARLKLDASVMDGLDQELKVPQAWLDGAAKEKKTIILGTWDDRQFRALSAPFRERYPFINLDYRRTGTAGRGMRVLIALGEGRVTADVLTSIADATFQFIKMKALADLRELPGFHNLPPEYVDPDGTWASFKRSYRCMAYNTTKVKKTDLPATWDDLLTNPHWRGGKLAVTNHPNAWLLALWAAKGEKWGESFTHKLFDVVKPQHRKEGMSAASALTVAGEFDANIPAPEWRVKKFVVKGAPVGYHCPTPVPVTVSQIVMLEKSPHKNASRIFINWMLSREGQILQYANTYEVPVHKALQSASFVPFADTILGKPVSLRDDAMLGSDLQKKMLKVWRGYWGGSDTGGKKSKKKKKR